MPTPPTDSGTTPVDPGQVGEVVKRLRKQRGLSLRDTARASGLSTSFLSAVERGESDISVGRLARLAACFGHDLGSLLGYSSRGTRPQIVGPQDRIAVSRGPGIEYEAYRLHALGMGLFVMRFEPGAGFEDEIAHEGIDATLALQGSLILRVGGQDYPLEEGMCATWAAGHPHSLRNESRRKAIAIGIGETVY